MRSTNPGFIERVLTAPDCPARLSPLQRLLEEHITTTSALCYARQLPLTAENRILKREAQRAADRCRKRWQRARSKIIVQRLDK